MKVRNGCVKMEYGLIGSKLTHSFSKYLHEEFLNTKYELKSLNIDELDSFFKEKDFNRRC